MSDDRAGARVSDDREEGLAGNAREAVREALARPTDVLTRGALHTEALTATCNRGAWPSAAWPNARERSWPRT